MAIYQERQMLTLTPKFYNYNLADKSMEQNKKTRSIPKCFSIWGEMIHSMVKVAFQVDEKIIVYSVKLKCVSS